MEEQGNYEEIKLYEHLELERRFVRLAQAVLNKYGKHEKNSDARQSPMTACWPEEPQGYHFKLHRKDRHFMTYSSSRYTLEHYIDELPKSQPLARYMIETDNFGKISEILPVDHRGTPRLLNEENREVAARQAMSILVNAVPREHQESLRQIVDRRFETLIGNYILSDLAVSDSSDTTPISESVTNEAIIAHFLRDVDILEEEAARSHESDSPAKQQAVGEAIDQKPAPNRHGQFTDVDAITTVKKTAGNIKKGWKHKVQPDQ